LAVKGYRCRRSGSRPRRLQRLQNWFLEIAQNGFSTTVREALRLTLRANEYSAFVQEHLHPN